MAPGIPTGALIHYLFIYFIKESAFMQNESEAWLCPFILESGIPVARQSKGCEGSL